MGGSTAHNQLLHADHNSLQQKEKIQQIIYKVICLCPAFICRALFFRIYKRICILLKISSLFCCKVSPPAMCPWHTKQFLALAVWQLSLLSLRSLNRLLTTEIKKRSLFTTNSFSTLYTFLLFSVFRIYPFFLLNTLYIPPKQILQFTTIIHLFSVYSKGLLQPIS